MHHGAAHAATISAEVYAGGRYKRIWVQVGMFFAVAQEFGEKCRCSGEEDRGTGYDAVGRRNFGGHGGALPSSGFGMGLLDEGCA